MGRFVDDVYDESGRESARQSVSVGARSSRSCERNDEVAVG